jgi:hypothetical protein
LSASFSLRKSKSKPHVNKGKEKQTAILPTPLCIPSEISRRIEEEEYFEVVAF